MKDKKVLIISHNAFSTTNNMGKTLASLFGAIDRSNIAQLYFRSESSDLDMCKTSFMITDREVLSSLYKRNKCGRIVDKSKRVENNLLLEKKLSRLGRKKSAIKNLARDVVWKIGKWKSKELFNWIEAFQPDVVFFASGYAMFSYNITLYICERYNIPLITYFCDDYYDYTYTNRNSLIANIRINLFKKKVRDIIQASSDLVFISDSMRTKYEKLFNKRGKVIMTPYTYSENFKKESKNPIKMSYVGNVMGNRWKTLIIIGKALQEINREGIKIVLEIYSHLDQKELIASLNIGETMLFKGEINKKEVEDIYLNSDILVHIESFEQKDVDRVKHSISTKIADYLASNRAILAVGPANIASIEYLRENNAAYIIDKEQEIKNKIYEYFVANNIDNNIIDSAKKLSNERHNQEINRKKIKDIINNLD